MSTGWIIALSIIGALILLLFCFFVFAALILSGKVDEQHEKDLEMSTIDCELLNELHSKLTFMTVGLHDASELCDKLNKTFKSSCKGFNCVHADLRELKEDMATTINKVDEILYSIQKAYAIKTQLQKQEFCNEVDE